MEGKPVFPLFPPLYPIESSAGASSNSANFDVTLKKAAILWIENPTTDDNGEGEKQIKLLLERARQVSFLLKIFKDIMF